MANDVNISFSIKALGGNTEYEKEYDGFELIYTSKNSDDFSYDNDSLDRSVPGYLSGTSYIVLDDINGDKGLWKTSEDERTKQKTKYLASEFLKTQNYSRRLVLYSQNAYFFISILAMMFFIRKQIKL